MREARRAFLSDDEIALGEADYSLARASQLAAALWRRPPSPPSRYLDAFRGADLVRQYGKVRQVIGVVIESLGPNMAVGETCDII